MRCLWNALDSTRVPRVRGSDCPIGRCAPRLDRPPYVSSHEIEVSILRARIERASVGRCERAYRACEEVGSPPPPHPAPGRKGAPGEEGAGEVGGRGGGGGEDAGWGGGGFWGGVGQVLRGPQWAAQRAAPGRPHRRRTRKASRRPVLNAIGREWGTWGGGTTGEHAASACGGDADAGRTWCARACVRAGGQAPIYMLFWPPPPPPPL